MATNSSILIWRIIGTEESSGLQSMGLQKVRYDWVIKLSLLLQIVICLFYLKYNKFSEAKVHFYFVYSRVSGIESSSWHVGSTHQTYTE